MGLHHAKSSSGLFGSILRLTPTIIFMGTPTACPYYLAFTFSTCTYCFYSTYGGLFYAMPCIIQKIELFFATDLDFLRIPE